MRVLVVDNDIVHARTMGEVLGRLGHTVTVVGSGTDGSRRIEAELFDIVVTDLMMNDIGGLEILARAKKASTETEVIVVTGHGTIPSAVSAMAMTPLISDNMLIAWDICFTSSWFHAGGSRGAGGNTTLQ